MRSLQTVRATMRFFAKGLTAGAMVASIGISTSANAEWQDPIDSPAIQSHKTISSLLLDVVSTGERLVAVGERGHIIYSDDNGISWMQADVPVMTTLTAVHFPDTSNGWAVGHDAVVLRTRDAGVTWEKQFDGFKANALVLEQAKLLKDNVQTALNQAKVAEDDDLVDQLTERLDTVTYALEDAQFDFDDRSTKPLLDVWFKNSQEGFVVGAYGMIFKTENGGTNWQNWSGHVQNPDRFHLNAITDTGANRLMIVGEMGTILRSANGGESFEKMFSPYEGSFFGVLNMNNDKVQIAFGLRGNLARTDDFGSTWTLLDTGTQQSLIGGVDRRGRVAYLVGNGGVFAKGIDSGRKWEATTRSGRSAAAAVVETNAGHMIVVGENGIEVVNKSGENVNVTVNSVKG